MRRWSFNLAVVGLLFGTVLQAAEERSPSVGEAIQTLAQNAASLAQSFETLQETFLLAAREMETEANSTNATTYQTYLKQIVQTESVNRNGSTVKIFIAPNRLRSSTARLWQWWQDGYKDESLKKQFSDEVQPSYARTIVTAYVYSEFLRRAFTYNNAAQRSVIQRSTAYTKLLEDNMRNLHDASQALMSTMAFLRGEETFSETTPDWEGLYGRIFHVGKVLNLKGTNQVDITSYFAPFYYPSLLPNPALDSSSYTDASIAPKRLDGSSTSVSASKAEPDYIKDSGRMQRLLMKTQYLVDEADLTYNDEMTLLLETFQEELEAVEDAPVAVTKAIAELKDIQADSDELEDSKLKQRLQRFLSILRPGRGSFSPMDQTKMKEWKWDAEKGLLDAEEAAEAEEDADDKTA